MSLRKNAKILGISPAYLSLLIGGKMRWREDLKDRYEELVNTFVNTNGGNETAEGELQDNSCLEMVPRKGLEPSLPKREADLSRTF